MAQLRFLRERLYVAEGPGAGEKSSDSVTDAAAPAAQLLPIRCPPRPDCAHTAQKENDYESQYTSKDHQK